ncbi:MAG TPA: hypothetical protein VLQ79_05435, partial [Myxococcaceae bacterium]|nr:hypothetical protein [Myxococcaceae bacterium]
MAIGCGASSPTLEAPSGAPTQLTITPNPPPQFNDSQTFLDLQWIAPRIPVDSYVLAVKEPGGTFQDVKGGPVSGAETHVSIFFSEKLPELTVLTFRVTAIAKGAGIGAVSRDFTMPLNSPSFTTIRPGAEGIRLDFFPYSAYATRVRIQRSDGVTQEMPIARPPGSVSFLDEAVAEDVTYSYDVTLTDAVHASLPWSTDRVSIPLLKPRGFTFSSSAPGVVELTWRNPSRTAQSAALMRWEGDRSDAVQPVQVGVVAPSAEHFVDAVADGGLYTYQLTYTRRGALSTSVQTVATTAFVGPPAFRVRSLRDERRSGIPSVGPDGGVYLIDWHERLTLSAPNGAQQTWDSDVSPTITPGALPGFVYDSRGRPHLLLRRGADGGPFQDLLHAWFDGAGWRSEFLSPLVTSAPRVTLALGAEDEVRAAWLPNGMEPLILGVQQTDGGFALSSRLPSGGVGYDPDEAVAPFVEPAHALIRLGSNLLDMT